MTIPSDDELERLRLDSAQLAAHEAPPAPATLMDRVMSALRKQEASPAERTRRPSPALKLVVLLAAVGLVFVGRSLLYWPTSGQRKPDERESLRLGARGVAVAEPGAALSWRIGLGGTAAVNQTEGAVFYRVESGPRFVVTTPAGDIEVRGTCFRVEVETVKPNRQTAKGMVAGAAIASAVFVSVYEGKVLFANRHGAEELRAGERATASAATAPSRENDVTGDPSELSREALVQQNQIQRGELAALQARLKRVEDQSKQRGGDPMADTFRVLGLSHDELLARAKDCHVAWDLPPLDGKLIDPADLARDTQVELSPQEKAAASQATRAFVESTRRSLQKMYAEIAGDPNAGEQLSAMALMEEITGKTPRIETWPILQRLAQERAGLATSSTDPSQQSVLERYYRFLTGLGDQYEHALAGALGAEKARQMRMAKDGWPGKMALRGCPGCDWCK